MADIVDKATRSKMMATIRGKNTRIEIEIRKRLWAKGLRYRLHFASLPGKPDIVFPESKIAIFADGDFWHGKDFKKWKSEVPVFWRKKIAGNILRDRLQDKALRKAGYRVLRFYGSKIKRNSKLVHNAIKRSLE